MTQTTIRSLLALLSLLALSARGLARSTPRFEAATCPFDRPEGQTIDCGYLFVPEDHSDPSSKEIKLAVATIYASGDNPQPDPIVYLEGGPGGSALDGVDSWVDFPFMDSRAVILLDQRGTGYSEPTLNCPELDSYDDESAATQACHDRLVNQGVNLADYNSAQSAADVADLRTALGLDQINLLGISYGTRLALTVMRDHPQGIRSVVIDSVYPPQVNAYEEYGPRTADVFGALYNGCAANPRCNAAYPHLEDVLAQTVAALNENPASYTSTDPDTGEKSDATLSGDDFIDTIFGALYDSTQIPYIPMVIYGVHQGNYALADDLYNASFGRSQIHFHLTPNLSPPGGEGLKIVGFLPLSMQWRGGRGVRLRPIHDPLNFGSGRQSTADVSDSEGMYNSVECREEVPFNDEQKAVAAAEAGPVELQTDSVGFIQSTFDDCKIWNVPQAAPTENQPVVSDLPTLVLTGDYDPITPADWGKQTASYLSHSFAYEFPGVGHDAIDSDSCPVDMVTAFFDNPTAEPDSSCIAQMHEPDFVVQ